MTVTFSTAAYEFAHGKKPRGYGYWAFFFDGKTDIKDAQFFVGTFKEAKEMAKRYAVTRGYSRVSVGS